MIPFQRDNLCRSRPEYRPSTDTLASIVASVARDFDVREPRVSAATERNGTTRCFLVEESRGSARLFVKTSTGDEALARFRLEADRSIRLHDAGAPVPRVLGDVIDHDGFALLFFRFLDGDHFSGAGDQLRAAAEAFGQLTTVAASVLDATFTETSSAPLIEEHNALAELESLCRRGRSDDRTASVCRAHEATITRSVRLVTDRLARLSGQFQHVHLDYHPLNLLFDGDKLVAVLDFEDLVVCPLAIASGFGAYKLIRRAAVEKGGTPDATLVDVWAEATGLNIDRAELESGARMRVLTLLHRILRRTLEDDDDRFLFDLPKHANALAEIDMIFQPGD